MNKVLAIINLVVGVFMACYIGGYGFFVGGIRDILNHVVVIGNTLNIENIYLILGSLKLVVASTVFIFILYVIVGLSNQMWNRE